MSSVTTTAPHLSTTLRFSVMRLARRMRQQRIETSLTLTQIATLATVERCGPLTPGELATHERVQPPSMTRCLSSLDALGLVDRVDHPDDGRQILVSITTEGSHLLEEDRHQREVWLARRLESLTEDERARLEAAAPVLEKLAAT